MVKLELKYSQLVPSWPISQRVVVYSDEEGHLWDFLYSEKGLKKLTNNGQYSVLGALAYILDKPSLKNIEGKVKGRGGSRLVLEVDGDEYIFEAMSKEELERTEEWRKKDGLKGLAEDFKKLTKELRALPKFRFIKKT